MAILIFLALVGGGVAGWWACRKHYGNKMNEDCDDKIIKENLFLRDHVEQLKQTLNYWQEQSAYNKEVANSTIVNHNTNLKNTLHNILSILQKENKESMKTEEREQVENIIKTIKGGISSSYVE